MDIEKLNQFVGENTLWINTATYMGIAAAEHFEAEGFKVNRFSRFDQSSIQQCLKSKKYVNSQQEKNNESHQ